METIESPVVVIGDELNNVIVKSNSNSDWGHIRVEQLRKNFETNGFLRITPISALIHGRIEDLLALNWTKGQELPGKIVFKDSLTPFHSTDFTKDLKVAGKTGITCKLDGQPIYRKTFYTTKTDQQDVYIAHNNQDEIKIARARLNRKHNNLSDIADL